VDWDFKGDTFHNQWQAFLTRKDSKLALAAGHPYDEPGEYRVLVERIDILGNDTTKPVMVMGKGPHGGMPVFWLWQLPCRFRAWQRTRIIDAGGEKARAFSIVPHGPDSASRAPEGPHD
jgi:hypothetical protein